MLGELCAPAGYNRSQATRRLADTSVRAPTGVSC